MLYWALIFFVLALVAALLGFGGVAVGAEPIAKLFFFAFFILSLFTFIAQAARRT